MTRLHSFADLERLSARMRSNGEETVRRLVISAGTCGQASGANPIIRLAKRRIIELDLQERLRLRVTGCHGLCQIEPSILVQPDGVLYPWVRPDQVNRIIDATLAGEVIDELLFRDDANGEPIRRQEDLPFFRSQTRHLLSQNEEVDPIRIRDYLRVGGYAGLGRILDRGDSARVIDEITRSGLRGRGGAGFSTGRKWALLREQDGRNGKYVVCNADEGDPGAYMDRGLLEGNPHSIIEGMIIAGYGVGATEGFIFVRDEYPLAIKHLIISLRQARDFGLLGEDILGSGFDFDISIVKSAGAFVCGEETALIRTIEGYMGEPRQRPPYPIQKGVYGRPTCINNVETLANVSWIAREGAHTFASIGTPKSTGTKVFSLVGKARYNGLVEVPMGMTIGDLVNDIGGGAVDGRHVKAVQMGGPSGGCIPARRFDLPIDYDSLSDAGAIMGSGGMIVMDDDTCMVDVAKYFMTFLKDESCGKCFTCRKGTQRMWEILDDISRGVGTLEQLDLLEELARVVKDTTMCGLGQSAPNPVLSALRYFRPEFERHIVDKRCDAYVCKDLVGAPCQSACPIGTEAWRYVAHIGRGEYERAYQVIRETNPFPSVCARVCDHRCESHCRLGATGQSPVAIRALKRFVSDNVDPAAFAPEPAPKNGRRVAVVGGGPAGLTAAHFLSLEGYAVTIVEAAGHLGGMLSLGIPEYRLPRETMRREIEALLNDRITVRCNTSLGKDLTIDDLFDEGFGAVFLALGALKSRRLMITGEDVEGVYPSMQFLRSHNHQGKSLATGRVGVVGGGNSAVDAARVALRHPDVKSVTILYRRTREEMPAFSEEIEAALEEGVELRPLVSPVRVLSEGGVLRGIECVENSLGPRDESGRRSPKAIEGSEFSLLLDTLVVAISEEPDTDNLFQADTAGLQATSWGSLEVDPDTLSTGRPGLFAGGDVVTGPNTVVDAIAAGKRAAAVIHRYFEKRPLRQPGRAQTPTVYVEPIPVESERERVKPPAAAVAARRRSFTEVEQTIDEATARCEAARCLRCDLDFTQPVASAAPAKAAVGGQAS